MNIEKLARRLKWQMVVWRLVGDFIEVFECFFRFVAEVFANFGRTFFYLELDAARRYKTLTGVDLGVAVGEDARYAGASRRAADMAESEIFGEGGDDDEG